MTLHPRPFRRALAVAVGLAGTVLALNPAEAGGPFARRRLRPSVETVAPAPLPRVVDRDGSAPMLGSFTPTPYITTRSDGRASGTAPLGFAGRDQSLMVYGPLSALRATPAPVNTVTRGYDGLPVPARGISYSYPNLPDLSPYVYPTRSSNYSALGFQGTPPEGDKAIMWIDQN